MAMERFRAGKFSAQESELEEIRRRAINEGKNPNVAVAEFLARIEGANARVKEDRGDVTKR